MLLLTGVVGRVYPFRLPEKLFSGALAATGFAAFVAAIALVVSSR